MKRQLLRFGMAEATGMTKRQKVTLTVLGVASVVTFYASAVVPFVIVLLFPIGYAVVVVRNWHKP